jgi:hypothetical protein
MQSDQFIETTHLFFGDLLKLFDEGEEYTFYNFGPQLISRIGFATNITPDIVRQAADKKVDLIITHKVKFPLLRPKIYIPVDRIKSYAVP